MTNPPEKPVTPQGTMRYRGRFAPSPTGPLHMGSLIAAVASYLEARQHDGEWMVRIEDLDPPREQTGAAENILQTLEQYGFTWDGPVIYQSQRSEHYTAALEQLRKQGLIYPCTCSRKQVAAEATNIGIDGPIYAGKCRARKDKPNTQFAWRIKVNATPVGFFDALQGQQLQRLDQMLGDFVLRRADGYFAYQLAVVVDDQEQKINHIVRGEDLLDSTPRQIYLQQCLDFNPQSYLHIPVLRNQQGEKLSKQSKAPAIPSSNRGETLWYALEFLGQHPPRELQQADIKSLWAWARESWRRNMVPPSKLPQEDNPIYR